MKRLLAGGWLLALGICLGCEIGVEQAPPPEATAEAASASDETAPVAREAEIGAPIVGRADGPTQQGPLEVVTRPRIQRLARGQLQFVEGFSSGSAEAARQSKPMMLFFTAPWCDYCHQMAAEAFTHPQVVGLSERFVCVLVNAQAEPDVCRKFGVAGYPTIVFLSPRGVALNRMVGKQPPTTLMVAMQAALKHVAQRVKTPRNPAL